MKPNLNSRKPSLPLRLPRWTVGLSLLVLAIGPIAVLPTVFAQEISNAQRKKDGSATGRDQEANSQRSGKQPATTDRSSTERSPSPSIDAANSRQRSAQRTVSPKQERSVLAFVKEHHPELTQLLVYLKENNDRQYTAAIRELVRTQERLSTLAGRDEVRYNLELENWRLESRSRLVAAKIQMKDRPALREELRSLLAKQIEIRQELLELDKQRVVQRLDRLQQQLDRLESESDAEIERMTRMLLRERAGRRRSETESANDKVDNKAAPKQRSEKDKDEPS